MTCPFFREAQVKYCQTAAVRKLIPLAVAGRADEKCGQSAHTSCAVYRGHAADLGQAADEDPSGPCPHLRESLMQYCGAAPVVRFVPYSESLLSRCGNDGYRYCQLYLSMSHPGSRGEDDGVAAPDWLSFSANHMWLDTTGDGLCHAGIDAFLSRALGPVERVSYVWQKGRHRPAAVLTASGIDLEVVFPNPFLLTGCNLYLRADPSRISSEPYAGGWLFEGTLLPETAQNLVHGPAVGPWMEQEQRRMNEFLQQQASPDGHLAADGGLFAAGLPRYLERESMMALFHEFFSPGAD